MLNINFGSSFLLGLFVGFIGISLYSIKFINPKISKDKDIFLSTLFLIYSAVLVVHGWRLDPILFFSQCIAIFLILDFYAESIDLRLSLLKQQKRKDLFKKKLNVEEKTIEKSSDFFDFTNNEI